MTEEGRQKMRLAHLGKSHPHTEEWNENIRKALIGRKISWADKISQSHKGKVKTQEHLKNISLGHLGLKQSSETIEKRVSKIRGIPRTLEVKEKLSISHKGAKCNFWKGGLSPVNKLIRRSLEFRLWREAVFKRDDYTCQLCDKRGGILHPDHIKPFAYYPELRFELSNGRTLCRDCHMKTPTWGGGAKQFMVK